MRKFVLATLAALALGTAAFAQPAEARCWWNGYSWHCWRPQTSWGWRHYHHWGPRHAYDWNRYHGYGPGYGPRWHSGWGY